MGKYSVKSINVTNHIYVFSILRLKEFLCRWGKPNLTVLCYVFVKFIGFCYCLSILFHVDSWVK
jgi:hypothetical protein